MGLFKKKEHHPVTEPMPPQTMSQTPSFNPSVTTQGRGDSGYATSEGRSNLENDNVVPMENHGQIRGVSSGRNLAVNESNGDVMDGDTGEIISTVTTTTTTTTTTRSRPGKHGETSVQVSNSTQPAPQVVKETTPPRAKTPPRAATPPRATTPPRTVSPPPNIAEVHADPIRPHPQSQNYNQSNPVRPGGGAVAPASSYGQPNQHSYGQPQGQPQSHNHPDSLRPGPPTGQVSYGQPSPQPTVPTRNPDRKSREYTDYRPQSPPSPPRPNFSYPNAARSRSSTSLGEQAAAEQPNAAPPTTAPRGHGTLSTLGATARESMNKGTLGDLKKAAIGLHGVGEQLRGTLNNEFDNRLSRPDSERAAYARQKNQAVLDRAQQEMGRLDRGHNPAVTQPQTQTRQHEASSAPPLHQQPTLPQVGAAPTSYTEHQTPVSPIQHDYDGRPWDGSQTQAKRRDMEYMPPTFSPESTSAPREERRGFRKLMKPRP
ncbi:hypothetical protein MBLNU457_g1103t1 [Dothideomycetes sp. NU457]